MSVNMAQFNNKEKEKNDKDEATEIKELVKKNLELTEKILKFTKKLDNYRKWQQVYGVLKLFIFVIPIILGIIYLPALLEKVLKPYNELLNLAGKSIEIPKNASDLLKTLKVH